MLLWECAEGPGNYNGCASTLYGNNVSLWRTTHLPVEGRWSLCTTSHIFSNNIGPSDCPLWGTSWAAVHEVEFCTADLQSNKMRERSLQTGSLAPSCMEPSSSTQSFFMGPHLLIVSATIYRGTRTQCQHRHGELQQVEENEWHQFCQQVCNLSFGLFKGH